MLAAGLALILGYLLGSIPTAAWLARLRGASIFEVGSGNMGAMNTARNLGFGLGVIVLALDVAKGALATTIGLLLAPSADAGATVAAVIPALAAGFGAVVGHSFSLYAGFRGGKGLATTLGVALPLYPWGGLVGVVMIVALTLLMRPHSGWAAVVTICLYPALVGVTLLVLGASPERTTATVLGVAAIAVVVLVRHALAFRRERRRAG